MIATPNVAPSIPEGPAEIWIHDVILGLSFKAESAASLEKEAPADANV